MDSQLIFDLCVSHLYKQKQQSKENNILRYKSSAGLKSPFGLLIEEKYKVKMEGLPFWFILKEFNVPAWMKEYQILIDQFETIHNMDSYWQDPILCNHIIKRCSRPLHLNENILCNKKLKA